MSKRTIMHYDMDAFFASVEIKNNPKLRGLPMVVGTSIVTTASYEARKFGIKSAMPVFEARKLCPKLVVIPTNKNLYLEASEIIQSLVKKITHKVEFISLDEGYVDITFIINKYKNWEDFATKFQERIFKITGLTCSVGIGYNKLTAKIASDVNKPAGIFIIKNEQEFIDYIKDKPVKIIPGVGKKFVEVLTKENILKVNDVYKISTYELRSKFGESRGNMLYYFCRGLDDSEVEYQRKTHSIGNENTYRMALANDSEVERELEILFERVYERLIDAKLFARTVVIKIKFDDFRLITRSFSLQAPTNNRERLFDTYNNIYSSLDEEMKNIKLVGISFGNLSERFYEQLRLY
ncbi:MAG: DNA polymerase IV [Fusobacteriaceae bacterium]